MIQIIYYCNNVQNLHLEINNHKRAGLHIITSDICGPIINKKHKKHKHGKKLAKTVVAIGGQL